MGLLTELRQQRGGSLRGKINEHVKAIKVLTTSLVEGPRVDKTNYKNLIALVVFGLIAITSLTHSTTHVSASHSIDSSSGPNLVGITDKNIDIDSTWPECVPNQNVKDSVEYVDAAKIGSVFKNGHNEIITTVADGVTGHVNDDNGNGVPDPGESIVGYNKNCKFVGKQGEQIINFNLYFYDQKNSK